MNNLRLRYVFLAVVLCFTTQFSNAQEFRRDIDAHTFVPQGQWIVGAGMSYSEHYEEDYQFLVMDGISGSGYKMNITPLVAYTIRNNLALGGRFNYSRSLMKLDNASLSIDDDLNFDVKDLYKLKHGYSAIAIIQNYISLGNSKRFAIFNELQFEFGGSQSKMISGKGEDITGVYQRSMDLGVGLAPGFVAFINNYTAVQVNVGVLGFHYTRVYDNRDQIYDGSQTINSANFKVNLFSIGLGIAFYI